MIVNDPSNVTRIFLVKRSYLNILWTSRSVHVYSVLQRACDPEYAAMVDAQPKPKGRSRKKAT